LIRPRLAGFEVTGDNSLLAEGQPKIREIIETENKPSGLQSEAALNCNLRQQC
jgi:hypothetical protein